MTVIREGLLQDSWGRVAIDVHEISLTLSLSLTHDPYVYCSRYFVMYTFNSRYTDRSFSCTPCATGRNRKDHKPLSVRLLHFTPSFISLLRLFLSLHLIPLLPVFPFCSAHVELIHTRMQISTIWVEVRERWWAKERKKRNRKGRKKRARSSSFSL